MKTFDNPADCHFFEHAEIKYLVCCRFEALVKEIGEDDVNEFVTFIVLERGDGICDLNRHLGFSVLQNRFTGARFNEVTFTPSFEFVYAHDVCYEVVFVQGDDGAGIELFVPKDATRLPELLAMCKQHAVRDSDAGSL